jgi:TBC1 domain family member 10
MDMHLRGYFATNAIQLEVDAALFSKGLEANEPALVKKLFVQLQLQPVKVCEPW